MALIVRAMNIFGSNLWTLEQQMVEQCLQLGPSMVYHLLVSKCTSVGGVGIMGCDSVDDEGVDISDRLGSGNW